MVGFIGGPWPSLSVTLLSALSSKNFELQYLEIRSTYLIPREFLLRGEGDDAQICASSNFASKLPNKSVNLPPLKSLKRGETGNSNLNQVNNDFP